MAKGKGKIQGWITKNGIHIPIYEKYTVREGHEPDVKKATFKKNSSIKKEDVTIGCKLLKGGKRSRTPDKMYFLKHRKKLLYFDIALQTFPTQKRAKEFLDKYFSGSITDDRYEWR